MSISSDDQVAAERAAAKVVARRGLCKGPHQSALEALSESQRGPGLACLRRDELVELAKYAAEGSAGPPGESATVKDVPPEQIGHTVLEAHYGRGTEWDETNVFGERGFTRAQAETDITDADVTALIVEAILLDRSHRENTPQHGSRG